MSHRTNYALREHGRVRFSTSRHGGTGLPDLLFAGPGEIEAYLLEDEAVEPEVLYDRVWCEGLLLIDRDERVVLFDGVSELMYDGPLRRLCPPLLETLWPGWRLYHAPDPVRHLGLHLGLPEAWREAKGVAGPLGFVRDDVVFTGYPDWWGNEHQTEVQWLGAAGHPASAVVDVMPTDLLGCGPRLLDLLPRRTSVEPRDRLPPWGLLVIDAARRSLRVWTDVPVYRLQPETQARWPGWTVGLLSIEEAVRLTQNAERFFPTHEEAALARTTLHERLGPGLLSPAVHRAEEEASERDARLRSLPGRPASP